MIFEFVAGVNAEDIDAVSDKLSLLLGSPYERRSSLYLGEYNVFSCPESLIVKYNFVASEGEWDEPDYQHLHVLVRADETERPELFSKAVARLQLETAVVRYREWGSTT